MAEGWIEMLEQQPAQGQRILARGPHSKIGNILRYDKFNYGQWYVDTWRPLPEAGYGTRRYIQRMRLWLE